MEKRLLIPACSVENTKKVQTRLCDYFNNIYGYECALLRFWEDIYTNSICVFNIVFFFFNIVFRAVCGKAMIRCEHLLLPFPYTTAFANNILCYSMCILYIIVIRAMRSYIRFDFSVIQIYW